ncbi:hypothetical protein GHT06_016712 [Daphnia sinensis]|uniref:C2H2-type domain-containing protein n=1 Tax=Daphnia sinensis TaxID=1820382 RepID=A0AAD5PT96_9CRUS|nr:hypothetical protein GHT06_016712 [Daphnia sinensis]
MLATALASSSSWDSSSSADDLSSSGRRASHCHHPHNHRYNHQQQLEEANNTDQEAPEEEAVVPAASASAVGTAGGREKKSRAGSHHRSVHQIQVQLQLQHKQRHQSYVYPKLQLVQIDDAWYALNQTCLQIYQQLQMCGTAQLMPVDVVPLHKLPECVRKSLSPSEPDEAANRSNSRRRNNRTTSGEAHHGRVGSHDNDDDALIAAHADATDTTAGHVQMGSTFRVYDIMSDAASSMAASSASTASSPLFRRPTDATANGSHAAAGDKSWWSRFFQGNNSASNVTPATGGNATWMASCRRRTQSPAIQHPFGRRHRQIVQKLVEETRLAEEDNRRQRETLAVNGCGAAPSPAPDVDGREPVDVRREHEPGADGQFTCVVCQAVFSTHRLLQRHRERAHHFGCTVCCKSFKNWSSLQDHCELLSHWSEEDSDEDSGDDFDSDEYLFSSSDDE